MDINWDAVGAGAEVLGATATVVTLAYLALQIRQGNKMARFAAATTRVERRMQLSAFLSQSPEINRIFWAGLEAPEDLSPMDYHYFEAIYSSVLASYEASFYLRKEDPTYVAEWEVALKGIEWLVSYPCFEKFWATWKGSYATDFVAFVDGLATQTPERGASDDPV